MTTITFHTPHIIQKSIRALHFPYTYPTALLSLAFMSMFIVYVFLPHPPALRSLMNLSVLFVVVLPLVSFVLSIISIRQGLYNHEKGIYLAYSAFALASLYFMTALAVPLVLLIYYVVYTYII